MRTLLAGFAALLASVVLLPTTASADRISFVGRCPSCGVPIYGQNIVAGYDRCGHPILRTVPVSHSCRGYGSHHGHHGDHRGGGYGSAGYGYGNGGYGYSDYGYDNGYRSGCGSRPRVGFNITITR